MKKSTDCEKLEKCLSYCSRNRAITSAYVKRRCPGVFFFVRWEHTEANNFIIFLVELQPIFSQYSILIPLENVRNTLVS